jgi:hypothetical protein
MIRNIAFTIGLLFFCFAVSPASAACTGTPVHGGSGHACFGIAAGNWSNATTVWSATSGGVTCVCTPTTGDDVILDGSSGTGTYTIDGAISLNSFDASAAGALTLVHNAVTVTITGTFFSFSAAMTYTAVAGNRLWLFTTAGTATVTSAGKQFSGVTLNSTGTLQLQDAFQVNQGGSALLTVTQGTFNANNQTVTIASMASPNGSARTITMGSNTWTVSGDDSFQTTWLVGTTATLTAGTSTLVFTSSSTIAKTFSSGGLSYNIVTNSVGHAAAIGLSITGSPTIATLNLSAGTNAYLTTGMTITNAVAWNGTSGSEIMLRNNSGIGGTATVTLTAAGTGAWIAFAGITFATSSMTATNCFDLGGNTFNGGGCAAPSVGASGGHIIGGYLLRRDVDPAANDNHPMFGKIAA